MEICAYDNECPVVIRVLYLNSREIRCFALLTLFLAVAVNCQPAKVRNSDDFLEYREPSSLILLQLKPDLRL